jgi:DNA-binding XRE family transcriptional regulator
MENYTQVKRKERELFIDNMIFLREDRGWTQKELVENIGHGLKTTTLNAWENKRGFPPIGFCVRIATILGFTVDVMTTTLIYKNKKFI